MRLVLWGWLGVVMLVGCRKVSAYHLDPTSLANADAIPPRIAADSFPWVVSEGGAAGFIPSALNASSSFHMVSNARGVQSVLTGQPGHVAIAMDPNAVCGAVDALRSAHDRISLDIGIMSPLTRESTACIRTTGVTALSITPSTETDPAVLTDLVSHLDGVEALGVAYRSDEIAKILGARAHEPDGAALRYVNLVQSRISAAGFAALAQRRNLRALGFRGVDAVDHPSGVTALATLPDLERIDLSYGAITDSELAAFGSATKIRWLSLEAAPIGDDGASKLASLGALEYLNLNATRVTDIGVGALAALPRLRWLSLSGTKVTSHVLDALPTSLERIELPQGMDATFVTTFRRAHPKVKVLVDGAP